VPISTPTASPTPTWTAEEQGAVDAVHNYLAVWTNISQNLDTADWSELWMVASDPAANDAMTQWQQWANSGWHLVGEPTLDINLVTPGMQDPSGKRFHVYGCYIITGSYLADSSGNQVGQRGLDRSVGIYQVLHTTDDRYVVTDDGGDNTSC